MKVVVQSVLKASCIIDQRVISEIQRGYVLLVGFENDDSLDDLKLMAFKIAKLRFLSDENAKINLSIKDIQGQVLSISQFTLIGSVNKGNRPDFNKALDYKTAQTFYYEFNEMLKNQGIDVYEGVFGADMKIQLINDGPLTLIIDSKELK